MSQSNGIIRVGRKGLKGFAFGEDGEPFTVDVVQAFQRYLIVDDEFRPIQPNEEGYRIIPTTDMPAYHDALVAFVYEISADPTTGVGCAVTRTEALEFIQLLRQEYDQLAVFFRPKPREEPDSPDTSAAALRFSEEPPGPS